MFCVGGSIWDWGSSVLNFFYLLWKVNYSKVLSFGFVDLFLFGLGSVHFLSFWLVTCLCFVYLRLIGILFTYRLPLLLSLILSYFVSCFFIIAFVVLNCLGGFLFILLFIYFCIRLHRN
eukprot:TRINITY_DN5157_c0_g3_i1.p1 TRINITY_DN5157_c0_g3~~TRINITY_DN5157_c0_g3_i1.p1  ORF type:complete len:119 (+),score=3.05 TRINITY_DN5157_c0_g3_i1:350-706(+)